MYKTIFKPLFDYVISLTLLLVLSPVFLMITLILLLYYKSNPFFTQSRPGKHEKTFKVFKFRTMNDKRDVKGDLLADSERLNPVGYFLRKSSLDEIPQLVNVLKGDMSLIGPRPLLAGYLPLYDEAQKRRHDVRPGITGWAQVNGRNAISWQDKFDYDIFYVEHLSFLIDIKIFLLTVKKVIKKEGINQSEKVNEVPFTGSTEVSPKIGQLK